MASPQLLRPCIELQDSYLEGIAELIADGYLAGKLDVATIGLNFQQYLSGISKFESGEDIPEGFSRQSEFWLVRDSDHYLGTVKIRHELCNEYLRTVGGHIGYYIRSSERSVGYGNLILCLGLKEAKRIGLESVLITCSENNRKSQKVIEYNGGVFESLSYHEKTGTMKRFWVNLKTAIL